MSAGFKLRCKYALARNQVFEGGARCPQRAFVRSISNQPDEDIELHLDPMTKRSARSFGYFLPRRSSAAPVIAVTPVLMVGSGTGANLLECSEGSGVPLLWL